MNLDSSQREISIQSSSFHTSNVNDENYRKKTLHVMVMVIVMVTRMMGIGWSYIAVSDLRGSELED